MKQFFVTSCGTEIGKTFVTSILCRYLQRQGRRVEALKPVVSGFDSKNSAAVRDGDCGKLLQALDREVNLKNVEAISPWRFLEPLSPDMAARKEGREINFDELIDFCKDAARKMKGGDERDDDECDNNERDDKYLFIEGIGGAMVPLNSEKMVCDWIETLKIPAIVVTGNYLGAMSHSLSAIDVLMSRKIEIAAVVISERFKDSRDGNEDDAEDRASREVDTGAGGGVDVEEMIASMSNFIDRKLIYHLPFVNDIDNFMNYENVLRDIVNLDEL